MNKLDWQATALAASVAVVGVFGLSESAQATFPGNFANASAYDISLTRIELCQDAACTNSFVIGTGSQTFDIAGVGAGSDVGSYVDISGIPIGETWTHVRATLSTTITVTASGTDDQGTACCTDATDTTSSHTALGVGTNGACTATRQSLVVPNVDGFGASLPSSDDYQGFNISKSDNASTMTIVYPLAEPYVCKGEMPIIEVKFDTQSTLKFFDTNGAGAGNQCRLYPMPPTVTIAVSDP
ncbi:MAG: hypothetical protein ACPGOV_16640 [Magnetovibrionaceae bacterium]